MRGVGVNFRWWLWENEEAVVEEEGSWKCPMEAAEAGALFRGSMRAHHEFTLDRIPVMPNARPIPSRRNRSADPVKAVAVKRSRTPGPLSLSLSSSGSGRLTTRRIPCCSRPPRFSCRSPRPRTRPCQRPARP